MAPVPAPWKHQIETIDFLADRPDANDFSDAGVGKTRAQLGSFVKQRGASRLLVLCPKTLMYSAWGLDIEKFTPDLTYSLAYAECREEAFNYDTNVVITNVDAATWLADKSRAKLLRGFTDCVVDESSAFKHPTTKRSKALVALRKHFKRHRCMTATPNPITVTELWNPMMFIDGGKRLGNSYYHMRNIMQVPRQVGPGINHIRWDDRPGAAQAVDDLIADITIRHDFAKVMSHIPLNERSKRQFEPSPKARKLYTTMENDCVVALKDSTVTAVHAAALRTKLLQMASGAVYNGNEEGSYSLIDPGRYELIADLIDVRKHSLVFFNWKHQRDELAKEFSSRGYSFAIIDGNVPQRERDRIVSDFQAGAYKVILLHPRTGAHGLTLTRATTTIIASPIYEADLLKQAIHRTYRGGQENETETILIEALGTVEAKVYERLFEKEGRMQDLLTLIQNRRKT